MYKTTLYLNESEISRLKGFVEKGYGKSITDLVRLAIRSFLKKSDSYESFSFLRSNLKKGKSKKSSFGDAVAFQRKVRSEW
ncbi:MAG: hypothetical protein IPJ69_12435 [Deltaproteobacteria bacterium]|nr:MAG: hypothetical protein IPJ69_12435 [Deltaproteobacteria bacterium]